MWGYCLLLAAVAFVQEPGRIVGDTKFDLAEAPGSFLARAWELWEPASYMGHVQNQAYGYFWPMGPFFLVGDLLALPPWVTQRLWWTLLLCLAFVGVVRLARALGLGSGWTQVLAGFAFALSTHMLTLLGPTSVEAWPSALAPWVLLPLVRATAGGSVRRGAALSALVVATAGGVNAVAVSAVLPLGVLWILTRERGARRTALLSWWVLLVALATAWWVVPLLLLGAYSVPFLDYIENAPITTLPTSLPDVLAGTADWVAYVSPEDWYAGHLLAMTPVFLINAVLIAAVGLAGVVRRDNPHRAFLFLGLLTGVALVSFGYTGPGNGWGSGLRQDLLDAQLAPFRNLHKYDVVLKLPLVLGMAHLLSRLSRSDTRPGENIPRVVTTLVAVTAVAGVAAPAYTGVLAPPRSFEQVPDYWRQAAQYLGQSQGDGVVLALPASRFGDFVWGSPHDDVLQPLAQGPWAVRSVLPLGQPGLVRVLDHVTRVVESGRPSVSLAPFLAMNGVSRIVVRNDLDARGPDGHDPVLMHQVLDNSPGLAKVARFGPAVGGDGVSRTDNDIRVLQNRGWEDTYASVEVYAVASTRPRATAWEARSVPVVAGDPGAALQWGDVITSPSVLAGDTHGRFPHNYRILTDGLKRRETVFARVRNNVSATLSDAEDWALESVVPNHRLFERQDRWETVVGWQGASTVTASSSQSQANAPNLRRDRHPGAAIDGFPQSAWVSSSREGAVDQWWRVSLDAPRVVPSVRVRVQRVRGPAVTRLRLTTATGVREVDAPRPGRSLELALPAGATDFLEIRAAAVEGGGAGYQFGLKEVDVAGVEVTRVLAPPAAFDLAPEAVLLERDQDTESCVSLDDSVRCNDARARVGEDSHGLVRAVDFPTSRDYEVSVSAVARRASMVRALNGRLPIRARASSVLSRDVRASALAVVDQNPATAWVADADDPDPTLRLRWDEPVTLSSILLEELDTVAGANAGVVELEAGSESRRVRLREGRGTFTPLVTDRISLRFDDIEDVYSFEGPDTVKLPVAVSGITLPDVVIPGFSATLPLDLTCGTGPTVRIGEQTLETRLSATLADVMTQDEFSVEICGDPVVEVGAGTSEIRATRSALVRPQRLVLTAPGEELVSDEVRVEVVEWSDTRRVLDVAARDSSALLVVNENINKGWVARTDGEELPPQRVDGWRQGFHLPAGEPGRVVLEFEPNRTYQVSLVVGALGLLVVALVAFVGGRARRARALGTSSWADAAVVAVTMLLGGFVAGWFGAAAAIVALIVVPALGGARWAAPASGGLLAVAGGMHAWNRGLDGDLAFLPAHFLAVVALVIGGAAFAAKGPRFFRRKAGRSIT